MDKGCKFLHPVDPGFVITCKKSWKHCAYQEMCRFRQHPDEDYYNSVEHYTTTHRIRNGAVSVEDPNNENKKCEKKETDAYNEFCYEKEKGKNYQKADSNDENKNGEEQIIDMDQEMDVVLYNFLEEEFSFRISNLKEYIDEESISDRSSDLIRYFLKEEFEYIKENILEYVSKNYIFKK